MRRLASFGLFLSLASACRSTNSSLPSQRPLDCSDAGHLERVLSLLEPTQVAPDRRLCLMNQFQETLDPADRYDLAEMQKSSSQLQGWAYSKENIFDRKAYIRGPSIFKAHRRLIAEAQEEVLLQTSLWDSASASAHEILSGLKDLQINRRKLCSNCRPVVVRILANQDARRKIAALRLDPKVLDIQVLSYSQKALGTHQAKSLVVDGQIAMITGANVERFHDPDISWYEVGYMMGGAVAQGLRIDLINTLIRAGLKTERDGDEKLAAGLGTPYRKTFGTLYPVEKMMEQPLADKAGMPAVIAGRNSSEGVSNPNHNAQNRAFQALMAGAQKWIHIQTPNFNDETAIRALGAAVKRGVRVEIILSKLFDCGFQSQAGQGGQNERGMARFLREFSGVAPKGPLHDLRWFAMLKGGVPVRVVDRVRAKKPEERKNNAQAKFMAVDDEVVVVGSANMDKQSWTQARELNVLVFHPDIVKAWQDQVFAANYQISQPVTAVEIQDDAIGCPIKD